MPLADWNDVLRARKAADDAAPSKDELLALAGPAADELDLKMIEAAYGFVEALRLEIRALGIAFTYAIDEAIRARP